MTETRASWQPLAAAVRAYVAGDRSATLLVHDDHGDTDELRVSYLFRTARGLPLLETVALDMCRGSVLDLGAGVGCHSLILHERGFRVVPVEILPELVEVMHNRGLHQAACGDAYEHSGGPYDTVLLLMNGLGLAGTIPGLERLLRRCCSLLASGGQTLAASTDVRDPAEPQVKARGDVRYVGEYTLQLEFDDERGEPFPYLYVDPDFLASIAANQGLFTSVVERDRESGYLVTLTRPA